MSEWKRIISSPGRVLLLLAIPLFNLVCFLFDNVQGSSFRTWESMILESDAYRNTVEVVQTLSPEAADEYLTEREAILSARMEYSAETAAQDRATEEVRKLFDYVRGFSAYQKNVQVQAARQSSSSVFSADKTSFVFRNIQKTASDFLPLLELTIRIGNNNGLERWLSFQGSDYCFLFVLLLLIMAFFEEKKSGMSALIRTAPGGRGRLCITRLLILFCSSAVYTLLIFGGTFAASLLIWGGAGDLNRPVQSLISCMTCTWHCSLAGAVIRLLISRILSGVLIGVLLWFLLGFLSQVQLAWTISLLLLLSEYLLYTLIPVQASVSIFRHMNLFSYIHLSDSLLHYLNINCFRMPLSLGWTLILTGLILLPLLLAAVFLTQVRRYPYGNRDLLAKPVHLWNRFCDLLRCRMTMFPFEIYKMLILSGMLLFFLIAAFLRDRLTFYSYSYNDPNDQLYPQYVRFVEGKLSSQTYEFLEKAQNNIDSSEDISADFQLALDRLKETVRQAEEKAAQENREVWIVEQTRTNNVFGEKVWNLHRQNGIIVLMLFIALTAPLFSMENKSGMRSLLRSCIKGRQSLYRRKYWVMLCMGIGLVALIYSREWEIIQNYLGSVIDAPVKDIAAFSTFPLSLTLRELMLGAGALRLLALWIAGCVMLEISIRCQSWETAFLAGIAVLAVPSVFDYLQIPGFSLLSFMNAFEFFSWKEMPELGISLFVWCLLAVSLSIHAGRRWSHVG